MVMLETMNVVPPITWEDDFPSTANSPDAMVSRDPEELAQVEGVTPLTALAWSLGLMQWD